jgi:sRNA-binding regulator protein Hfq
VTTTPLKPPLAAGAPKPQRPPDAPKKPQEPDARLYTCSIAEKRQVELRLHDGSMIRGRVMSFGQFNVELETGGERLVVFKNFIATAKAADGQ